MKFKAREDWGKRDEMLVGKKRCPFCEENKEQKYIIWEGKYWYIKQNKYPYTGDEFHLMAIPKKHYEISIHIPMTEWQEFSKIHDFISEYFQGKEYFSFTRETMGCRSIKHLHIHFIRGVISAGLDMQRQDV